MSATEPEAPCYDSTQESIIDGSGPFFDYPGKILEQLQSKNKVPESELQSMPVDALGLFSHFLAYAGIGMAVTGIGLAFASHAIWVRAVRQFAGLRNGGAAGGAPGPSRD